MSTTSLEEIGAGPGTKVFQLYIFKDRDFSRELIRRAKQAGFLALCLTVDAAVRGKRERELRTGLGIPLKLSWKTWTHFALCPYWSLTRAGALSMPNVAASSHSERWEEQTKYIADQLDPSVNWKDVRDLIELWDGPFAIKGILSADDARRAADIGATAIFVSNHGGRQLDGAAAPIDVLPDIARAVGHRIEVILDGGVRRGSHVFKALALGATACSIGRAYLFGLAAGGQAGVARALTILQTELVTTMQLCGCTNLSEIDAARVRRLWPVEHR
jgi:L-lactate dehydrogenase (cytochrome)